MFDSILEHVSALRAVKNDCARERTAHCYILVSADALLLDAVTDECVYAILGGESHEDVLYRKVMARTHADVLYFPREAKFLNKDETDALFGELGFAPIDGTKRVFIINAAEQITPAMQNHLLKTLEEPQEGYVFILKATRKASLLQTVLSRACTLELGTLSFMDVQKGLAEITGVEKNDLAWAAEYADGNITMGKELLSRPEYRGMCELAWSFLNECQSSRDLLPFFDRLMGYEADFETAVLFFASALRDVLVYATTGESLVVARDRMSSLKNIAKHYSAKAASVGITCVQTAKKRLHAHSGKSIVADGLLLGILEARAKYPATEKV